MPMPQLFNELSLKAKVIIAAVLFSILASLWYFFFETNYLGRKVSRATGGIVAADYDAPDGARQVLSVSVSQDKSGDTAKNVAFVMKDCTVRVYEYRDGLRGMILEGRMKITQAGGPFKQAGCIPEH